MTAFRDRFMSELQPVGEMESLLVERIVASTWRLNRVLRTERKHARGDPDYRYSVWEKVSRMETTLERQIYKALHELERLQKARLASGSSPLSPGPPGTPSPET